MRRHRHPQRVKVIDHEAKRHANQIDTEHRPDRNPGDKAAEEQFKKINEAFSVLSDPQKKQMYDQYGHEGVNGAGGFGGFNANGFGDINDIFGSVFGDIFGGGFGGGRRTPRAQRGEDLKMDVADARKGTKYEKFKTYCINCLNGKGFDLLL